MRSFVLSLLLLSTQARVITKAVTADQVTAALDELVLLDENGGSQNEIVVDFQSMASSKLFEHDNAPNPLFKSVSAHVTSGPTFKAFDALQKLYTQPDVDVAEPNSEEKVMAANGFINAIFDTKVVQSMWAFLTKAGLSSTDASTFKKQIFDMWFTVYSHGAAEGSSGFETVFMGETSQKEVIGLAFWYRFYQLELINRINYHGYFAKEQGVQAEVQFEWEFYEADRKGILIGTSPEFEIAAYTLCALANVGDCKYTKEGNLVALQIKTATYGTKIVIDSVYPVGSGGLPTEKPGRTTRKPDVKLQEIVDAMRAADEDKPVDYKLDWGNPRSEKEDVSPNPLYAYLNEAILQRPIYKALIDVYNNNVFNPNVCSGEGEITGNRKLYIDRVFDAFTSTKVFQIALAHLQELGIAGDWETFKSQLFTLWFGRYTRCNGALGSSGWEHVFVGEWKGSKVDGQHSWVKYYLLEKAGQINYHGYLSYDDQLTGTFQYTWDKYLKNVGGFNTGTSPAFDFSVFSICALTTSGKNSCKFTIDGFPISVTSFTQSCEGGKCLSTVYPSDS